MDFIISYFNSLGIDFDTFWKAALILLLGTFLLSVFGRFVFGKRSVLNNAVSSAITIIFLYAITVVLHKLAPQYEAYTAPLPFVQISGDTLNLFSFMDSDYTLICGELLNMIILAFFVNIIDSWMPKGKNVFSWLLFRICTVILAYIAHLVVVGLLAKYLPQGLLTYAPVVLIALLVLLLLTGALKILVGALLTTVNPIIGGLYTFFFATVIGKQITKAVLTTAILSGIVIGLHYIGCSAVSIAAATLTAYIPLLIILLLIWFIVYRIF